MTMLDYYEMFFERYITLKEKYESMVMAKNPDAFLVRNTMNLNERLMIMFKPKES